MSNFGQVSNFNSAMAEHLKKIERLREEKVRELAQDPFMGFATLDEALGASKCSTQAEVLARLLNHENLFISGLAGSGKTTVINRFAELIDAEFSGAFPVAMTASTGIAATLIGGRTIHSWSGMGINSDPFDKNKIEPMMWNRAKEIKEAKILVIDEISMLPGYAFTKLDAILKFFRRNTKPFGGIQLILLGDFLQLPPVKRGDAEPSLDYRFAIETDAWKEASIQCCFMDKTHRASDPKLKQVLTEIARGRVSQESKQFLQSRMSEDLKHEEGKAFTTLYTTNANVDKFNQEKLAAIPAPLKRLHAKYVTGTAKEIQDLYKKVNVSEQIDLKVGATVILTKNLNLAYSIASGSVGKIVSFDGYDNPLVRFNNGMTYCVERQLYKTTKKVELKGPNGKKIIEEEILAAVEQYPLKLGFAITVHKSQGQTFDGVTVDLSKCFQDGLGYVALSRVRSLDDLIITNFNDKAYRVSPKSMKITNHIKRKALANRHAFIEEREHYESLLIDHMYRKISWPKDD